MKNGTWKRGVAALAACALFGTLAACDGGESFVEPTPHTVWSTYNTTKVMQNSVYNGNYSVQSAKITAKMAKSIKIFCAHFSPST